MISRFCILIISLLLFCLPGKSQHTDANIFGDVKSGGEHLPFATIYLEGTTLGTTTNETGHYMLIDLPPGKYVLVAKSLGYSTSRREVIVEADKTLEVNFVLEQEAMTVDELVVTGTRTFKRSTESPVIVNVLGSKNLEAVDACNISDGLKFQPGLRVETDCQTCNYTQLRMNGLGGSYSQVLFNGRPVFSPLMGLYGMEQIPANMVERIEVVRGGGSALYGSSAIGGTVNVITRIPEKNDYSLNLSTQRINKASSDNILSANATMVSPSRNAGAVIFANRRYREAYDHTGITLNSDGTQTREKDNYSELPELRNNSFGGTVFYQPAPNQRVEINFTSLYEYRYGGEMLGKEPHLAQQSEERVHNILMGGADYQINFNKDNSSLLAYIAGQSTDRQHYTGLYPVREEYGSDSSFRMAELSHLLNPPYGFTENNTLQGGVQLNHRIRDFISGTNMITAGMEVLKDEIVDSIPKYRYGTNQETINTAFFVQSDWKIKPSLTVLAGFRADKHNLLDQIVLSPRVSILYRLVNYTQFRLTWGKGFRAPQAFDSDMHIAFAGGGVSRIRLQEDLRQEQSGSFSGSVNFDMPKPNYILGFTADVFYTRLKDAFYLHAVGLDDLGQQYEKRNGSGAAVKGATLEIRANYNKKAQLEAGFTLQTSLFEEAVENIAGLEKKKEFLRTPGEYGYAVFTFFPTPAINASFSSIYTGPMLQAKFSPDATLLPDEYRTSSSFTEFSAKAGYTFALKRMDTGIELYAGIKNLTNLFQEDFDNYRNRDSNYMYGPSQPRTLYFGLKLKAL